MADNDAEREVRELIERWAHAVHVGDLDTVAECDAPDDLGQLSVYTSRSMPCPV